MTIATTDGALLRSVQLDHDLRDVVSLGYGGFLAVSTFRKAEVLLVDPTGALRSRTRPPISEDGEATCAWRMVAIPGETGVAIAHQRSSRSTLELGQTTAAYYGSGGIVNSVVSFLRFVGPPGAPPSIDSTTLPGGLPVDLAVDGSGDLFVAALYASKVVYASNRNAPSSSFPAAEPSVAATSVAYDATSRWIAFVREPPSFVLDPGGHDEARISIPAATSVADTGHDLFHFEATPFGGLACASCHPEGRDDGHVWNFDPTGPRRTPSLVGGLLATAPFHWDGDLPNMDHLMGEVFTNRMGGPLEDEAHVAAVARFLEAIPRIPIAPFRSTAPYWHGMELFESPELGCTSCHSGPHFTNNTTVDVGTGKAFQVPTLIGVGLRAPYLHDGCAETLFARFGPCGGGDKHGHTSQLLPRDLTALVTYLGSL